MRPCTILARGVLWCARSYRVFASGLPACASVCYVRYNPPDVFNPTGVFVLRGGQVPVRSVVPEQQQYQVKGQAMVPETRHIQVPFCS